MNCQKNKNILEGFRIGLFLNLAYVLMSRYQGLFYLRGFRNIQKIQKEDIIFTLILPEMLVNSSKRPQNIAVKIILRLILLHDTPKIPFSAPDVRSTSGMNF